MNNMASEDDANRAGGLLDGCRFEGSRSIYNCSHEVDIVCIIGTILLFVSDCSNYRQAPNDGR